MNEKAKIEQSKVVPEATMPRMQTVPVMPQAAPIATQTPMMPQMPMQQNMATQVQVEASLSFEMTYPLIYYRAMPYIMMACDEMEMRGTMTPSQEETDQMTDRICDDMTKAYPDLAGMAERGTETDDMQDTDDSMPAQRYGNYYRDYGNRRDFDMYDNYQRPFRRRRHRNNFGDIVNILLLSELLGRRRRYY
jgi:hypothetical protein